MDQGSSPTEEAMLRLEERLEEETRLRHSLEARLAQEAKQRLALETRLGQQESKIYQLQNQCKSKTKLIVKQQKELFDCRQQVTFLQDELFSLRGVDNQLERGRITLATPSMRKQPSYQDVGSTELEEKVAGDALFVNEFRTQNTKALPFESLQEVIKEVLLLTQKPDGEGEFEVTFAVSGKMSGSRLAVLCQLLKREKAPTEVAKSRLEHAADSLVRARLVEVAFAIPLKRDEKELASSFIAEINPEALDYVVLLEFPDLVEGGFRRVFEGPRVLGLVLSAKCFSFGEQVLLALFQDVCASRCELIGEGASRRTVEDYFLEFERKTRAAAETVLASFATKRRFYYNERTVYAHRNKPVFLDMPPKESLWKLVLDWGCMLDQQARFKVSNGTKSQLLSPYVAGALALLTQCKVFVLGSQRATASRMALRLLELILLPYTHPILVAEFRPYYHHYYEAPVPMLGVFFGRPCHPVGEDGFRLVLDLDSGEGRWDCPQLFGLCVEIDREYQRAGERLAFLRQLLDIDETGGRSFFRGELAKHVKNTQLYEFNSNR